MKTIKTIGSRTSDDLKFYYWPSPENEKDEPEPIILDEADIDELVKRPKFKKELLDSINCFVADIQQSVGDDLKDIWDRLDKIENF